MVSEKKPKKYEIAKIHEFLDNVTLPSEVNPAPHSDAIQKLLHKTAFDSPAPTAPPSFPEQQKTFASVSNTIDEESLPEFEPIPEGQVIFSENDEWLASYDLLEIEPRRDPNQGYQDSGHGSEPMPFELTPTAKKDIKAAAGQDHQLEPNNRWELKQRRKELLQKVKQERHEYLQQEKKAQQLKKLEERLRKKDARR